MYNPCVWLKRCPCCNVCNHRVVFKTSFFQALIVVRVREIIRLFLHRSHRTGISVHFKDLIAVIACFIDLEKTGWWYFTGISYHRSLKSCTGHRKWWMNKSWHIGSNFLTMASFSPDYYLRQYGSDQVPLSLGALQLEPADRAVLKIAGNLN